MDFTITKEQEEYKREIIEFARANLNDHEWLDSFSKTMWHKVADFGLFAINLSEEFSGLEESYLTAAIVIEALGYACKNNGFVFAINNHIWVAQNLIYLYGTELLREKYISSMVSGKRIGCFALTEAGSGSDALSMETTAKCMGDHYIINGNKMFVSNGPIADIFIVLAKTQRNPTRFTAFVVEKEFEGIKLGKEIPKMGLNACPTCEVILQNCKVPKENILGKVDSGSNIMIAALEWERCYEFAPHVGAMQRIMEECIYYVENRKQFGKPIKEFQAVSHKIADMKVSIELSRLMLYKVAWLKDQDKNAFMDTSIFKLYVSENYIKLCKNAIQIFGAYGYSKEYGIERELRDAIGCSIYSGTSEMQRNTIFSMAPVISYFD